MASTGSERDAKDALSKLLQMGTVVAISDGIKVLRARPTTLVEAFSLARIIEARFEAIAHEEKANAEKEQSIKETADTIASLQSDVASLKTKKSLDANEEIRSIRIPISGGS
ncbi:hypothetical protein Tco_0915503 [Tanacetum coccineum]